MTPQFKKTESEGIIPQQTNLIQSPPSDSIDVSSVSKIIFKTIYPVMRPNSISNRNGLGGSQGYSTNKYKVKGTPIIVVSEAKTAILSRVQNRVVSVLSGIIRDFSPRCIVLNPPDELPDHRIPNQSNFYHQLE
jgi:hypothetical protein